PEVTGMGVQLRRGRSANELAAFRYDVWLEVGGGRHMVLPREELRWDRVGSVSALRQALAKRDADVLVVRGVPNARVVEAVAALAWLRGNSEEATVGAWRQQRAQTQPVGVEPEEICEMARALGYDAHVGWGDRADTMDVLLHGHRPGTDAFTPGWQRLKR